MAINRRELLRFTALVAVGGAAAACSTSDGRVGVPVNVTLPPEVTQIIDDATKIVDQGKKLISSPSATSLIGEATTYIDQLKSGKFDFKSTVKALVPVLSSVAGLLPPPYGIAATVLVGLAGAYAGATVPGAARLAATMTPQQARVILAR